MLNVPDENVIAGLMLPVADAVNTIALKASVVTVQPEVSSVVFDVIPAPDGAVLPVSVSVQFRPASPAASLTTQLASTPSVSDSLRPRPAKLQVVITVFVSNAPAVHVTSEQECRSRYVNSIPVRSLRSPVTLEQLYSLRYVNGIPVRSLKAPVTRVQLDRSRYVSDIPVRSLKSPVMREQLCRFKYEQLVN